MLTDRFGNTYYKVGLHIHTTLSDGAKTPEEVAREYAADGYDAIALTDHWYYGESRTVEGLTVLSGCEYNLGGGDTSLDTMHIIGIGMKKDPHLTSDNTRQEVVDAINQAGGIAVLGHPNWSLNAVEDLANLKGITATEIYNAVSEAHNSLRAYSGYFVDLCANRGMYPYLLATDDSHYYDGSDNRRGWVMVRAENGSENALLDAIRRGDFYATQGPWLHAERKGNKIVIDCSPTSVIGTLSNGAWLPERVLRGENLTHFEYELKPLETWVRVEVQDAEGKYAWSNIFEIK